MESGAVEPACRHLVMYRMEGSDALGGVWCPNGADTACPVFERPLGCLLAASYAVRSREAIRTRGAVKDSVQGWPHPIRATVPVPFRCIHFLAET